ncbi:MAG: hypothetical protein KUG64_08035 [Cycloclasticus sp.]|nr:hypothetical protein [Cycloclasticus sp.]
MNFIHKYILPKEVDFNAVILEQASVTRKIVSHIQKACFENDLSLLNPIAEDVATARNLKTQNMNQLLDVLITPYDKESIFRIITQLDWIALSVKHFHLEIVEYKLQSLDAYQAIAEKLLDMSNLLENGIGQLPTQNLTLISSNIDQILELYDQVISACAKTNAELLQHNDCITIIRGKDIIMQLKEIAKRIYVAANTLEDMAIKVV